MFCSKQGLLLIFLTLLLVLCFGFSFAVFLRGKQPHFLMKYRRKFKKNLSCCFFFFFLPTLEKEVNLFLN